MTDLPHQLNLETAKLPWRDLATFFAGGRVIQVASGLDLLQVAAAVADDATNQVQQWLTNDAVGQVSDEQARRWHDADALVWAVVVKPWVLVQPVAP
jgi:hypothetical protein